ncbi:POT family proton-dependent oligopeptide transporter [Kibdelosporangium banguiense]|uniref:POT family proton-dependent oligopeptide transporter n=1 Tax=Kibdelosporangium banguiense TaxID=1365924 RepID=A0ABS4TP76_9PSEU|nr:oligopeptide:H+ symporter [Kibdelosporangium banguiense]MBP2326207.1 POT family proton-dependent oligopeptide transporter [Kibdelosporangium banguiense]
MTKPVTETSQRGFFGHPRALANLFGTEMWERFSFYGMQAILAYYLYYSATEGGLGLSQATAAGLVGAYGGLVYLASVGGAWVADRLLGAERTVFFGGLFIMFGHIALALIPGLTGVAVGLLLVIIGTGGLKSNVSALVGTLYPDGDERRDAGFSLFYMGVNIGAMFGPIVTGWLQTSVGFHLGFGAAAVGMAAGLVQYVLGRRNLGQDARVVPNPLTGAARLRSLALIAVGVVVIAVLVVSGAVTTDNLPTVVTWVVLAATIVYFAIILGSRKITSVERSRVFAFIPLFIVSFGFWALFQQQFTVLPIYADTRVNLDALGFHIPPAVFNSVEPACVIILAPLFAYLWTKLGERQPSTTVKFSLGVAGMGVAFLLMVAISATSAGAAVNPLLLALILLVFAIAEMCLSPVGLSASTKLAPKAFGAQMVALFYLSIALGSSVAGELAAYYSPDNEPAYFGILGAAAIVLGVVLFALSPLLRRLMKGVH